MPLLNMPLLCVNFIVTIFLFIVSSPTSHGADNENYTTCHEKKYDCGEQIKGIGYPFWGEDRRPQFCGVQGFELKCQGNENTTIVIEKQEFRVLHIDQSAYSMTIARADLWDNLCPGKFSDTTLNWNLLDYGSNPLVVNLTLVYDCPPIVEPPAHTVEERSHFQCQVGAGGQSSNINFFVNESCESIIPQNCKTRIKVPVFQETLDAFWVNNTIHVEELVKQGFGVDYHDMDYFRHCVACTDSGGECGTDTTTNQAICLCHDGHQSQMCPRPGPVPEPDFRKPPANFRQYYFPSKDLKKLLELPVLKRRAPLLLNFIPTYKSTLLDVPKRKKKSLSPPTATTQTASTSRIDQGSTSNPADLPSTSAPFLVPIPERKRRRRLVKTAEMGRLKPVAKNLLADLPSEVDADDQPSQPMAPPKQKRIKKTQPKAKTTDAEAEEAVPISQLAENKRAASVSTKRPAEAQPSESTQSKKSRSSSVTTSGSRVPKVPWRPEITLEDKPVFATDSADDVNVGVALSTAVLLPGDLDRNAQMSEFENYALMLQHSVQGMQHAHSFSVQSFKNRERLVDAKREIADLQKTNKGLQAKMKKLKDQAEAAIKAQNKAEEKAEAAEVIKKVAEAERKEAEEKAAQAEKELQDALATKEADIKEADEKAYTQGMADVTEAYELQVKQACNKGFTLGWTALLKKLNVPDDSPLRNADQIPLPFPPPPPPQSDEEEESEDGSEEEEDALVRKQKDAEEAKSPPLNEQVLDLTQDEEGDVDPKEAVPGVLSSDALLFDKTVEETISEIDAEIAVDKEAEVPACQTADVPAQSSADVEEL